MNKETIKQNAWTAVVIIAILGFSTFGIYQLVHDDSVTAVAQTQTEIADVFKPDTTTIENEQESIASTIQEEPNARPTEDTAPRGEGAVLGATTETTTPQLIEYRNQSYGFRTVVLSDAMMDVKTSVITANHPGGGAYWEITSYGDTKETIESIQQQIAGSPSTTKVAKTSIGGEPAVQFYAKTINGSGIAVIHNHRLYYIIGNFTDGVMFKEFKFI